MARDRSFAGSIAMSKEAGPHLSPNATRGVVTDRNQDMRPVGSQAFACAGPEPGTLVLKGRFEPKRIAETRMRATSTP